MLIALLISCALFAQTPAELDKAWTEAVLKKDFAALDKMLAPNLVYAHATGIVDTKQSYIEKIRGGKQVYKTMAQQNVTAHKYGNAAVTHSWMRVTGVNQAGPFDDKVMLLHMWVKSAAGWQLVAHQTTRVDKLP